MTSQGDANDRDAGSTTTSFASALLGLDDDFLEPKVRPPRHATPRPPLPSPSPPRPSLLRLAVPYFGPPAWLIDVPRRSFQTTEAASAADEPAGVVAGPVPVAVATDPEQSALADAVLAGPVPTTATPSASTKGPAQASAGTIPPGRPWTRLIDVRADFAEFRDLVPQLAHEVRRWPAVLVPGDAARLLTVNNLTLRLRVDAVPL